MVHRDWAAPDKEIVHIGRHEATIRHLVPVAFGYMHEFCPTAVWTVNVDGVANPRNGILALCITVNDFGSFLDRVKPYRDDLTVVCECTFV